MHPKWFLYVLRCNDGSLYTGIALDVYKRIAVHESGRGARYTRGRGPFELCGVAKVATQGDALFVERQFKRLPRARKLDLASTPRALGNFVRRSVASRARMRSGPGSARVGAPTTRIK